MAMSIIIKLTNPLTTGETELELREPTVDDVVCLGYPFVMDINDGGTSLRLQPKVILKYASRLGAIPPSSLKTITIGDLSAIQEAVMGFFGDGAATPQI